MNGLMILSMTFAVIVVALVVLPFFKGEGGQLQDASVSDDVAALNRRQEAILSRWIREETAAAEGGISSVEWHQRQRYLIGRFVDTARRLDWVKAETSASDSDSRSGGTHA